MRFFFADDIRHHASSQNILTIIIVTEPPLTETSGCILAFDDIGIGVFE